MTTCSWCEKVLTRLETFGDIDAPLCLEHDSEVQAIDDTYEPEYTCSLEERDGDMVLVTRRIERQSEAWAEWASGHRGEAC